MKESFPSNIFLRCNFPPQQFTDFHRMFQQNWWLVRNEQNFGQPWVVVSAHTVPQLLVLQKSQPLFTSKWLNFWARCLGFGNVVYLFIQRSLSWRARETSPPLLLETVRQGCETRPNAKIIVAHSFNTSIYIWNVFLNTFL